MKMLFAARVFSCIVFPSILVCPQTSQRDVHHRIYVGILDDAREEMANWKPGVAQERFVRPAFEKTGARWRVVNSSLPLSSMTWIVAFDGKNIGTVKTQASSEERYTPVQKLLPTQYSTPQVGSPSQQFAGLLGDGETKVRRPLVVVSKPYFRDPDGWKRTKLPNDIAALVRTAFRRDYPHVDRCKDEEIAERNWRFPDSALSFPVAYSSNRHSFLVEASLDAGDCGYISEPDEPESEPWFFVSSDGNIRRIGSFLTLLDAGDYDNDGRSEVVFFLSQGDNTDGFVLFDSAFEKPVTLTWHYH